MTANSRAAIAERLAEARERTLALIEPLDDEQLNTVYSPLLSPLAWDLGHIANFEELWLVQTIGGREPLNGELGRFYDAIENPRKTRGELPILRDAELRAYMADVRERALEVLDVGRYLAGRRGPVAAGRLRLRAAARARAAAQRDDAAAAADWSRATRRRWSRRRSPCDPSPRRARRRSRSPAGEYEIGAPERGFAYDNERRRHPVELAAFEIDRAPVSNAAYAEFIEATGAEAPMYWERDGDGWISTAMGRRDPIAPGHPVIHVSWEQADAFARWAGKRLPTEFGVGGGARRAASRSVRPGNGPPRTSAPTRASRPFPIRSTPRSSSATSTRCCAAPAWATHPDVVRPSFRNWDLPQRRQIFAGLRCARDA